MNRYETVKCGKCQMKYPIHGPEVDKKDTTYFYSSCPCPSCNQMNGARIGKDSAPYNENVTHDTKGEKIV